MYLYVYLEWSVVYVDEMILGKLIFGYSGILVVKFYFFLEIWFGCKVVFFLDFGDR